MIRFPCPHCRVTIKAKPERAGARVSCPRCGGAVVVPVPVATVPEHTELLEVLPDYDHLPEVLPCEPVVTAVFPAPEEAEVPFDWFIFSVALLPLFMLAFVIVGVWVLPRSAMEQTGKEFSEAIMQGQNPPFVLATTGINRCLSPETDQNLGVIGHPFVWGFFLVLTALAMMKDSALTLIGPLKTPLDAIGYLAHWAGFLLGLLVIVMDTVLCGGKHAGETLGFTDTIAVLLAVVVYPVVFIVHSMIEAAIIVNPIPFVDSTLKTLRSLAIGFLFLLVEIHPVLGFVASLIVYLVCLWLLHFSIRVSTVATVYSNGIIRRLFGWTKSAGEVKAFSCWNLPNVPWFSYGRLQNSGDRLRFVYKRFFLFWERSVSLPARATLTIGAGSINPYLLTESGKTESILMRFSPAYCNREQTLGEEIGVRRVKDISWSTGIKQLAFQAFAWAKWLCTSRVSVPGAR